MLTPGLPASIVKGPDVPRARRSLRRFSRAWAIAIAMATAAVSFAPAHAIAPPNASAPAVRTPCSALDPALCLLPFPNNRFTTSDATTATGRRIDFQVAEMPRNLAGKPFDPSELNRNDGFSPGSEILTFVPGLDLHQTWGTTALSNGSAFNDPADHIADIARYQAADAPILVLDVTNPNAITRWPFWSELDTNEFTKPTERILILRPAKNFLEGHRYVVALRNMKDVTGTTIPAGPVFGAIRDGVACDPSLDAVAADEAHHTACLIDQVVASQGASRSSLYLAWDFSIASGRNLAERVLHIRDDAFAQLGDTDLANGTVEGVSPKFAITAKNGLRVEGTITVPNYTTTGLGTVGPERVSGVPNQAVPVVGRFVYGPDGLPMQNPALPTIDVPFVCTIPSVATAANPADPTLYGHGLLGSRRESQGGSTERDRENNIMPCAMNWMGFAEADVAGALITLSDPSNMTSMMDRTQQGMLNVLYLARALAHPNGLSSDPAFSDGSGSPLFTWGHVVDGNLVPNVFYDGNSQGGILGGAIAALSVDVTRATIGVTGMNYSTLLNRSSDWEGPFPNVAAAPSNDPTDYLSYSGFLYTQFPNKMEQQLVMALLQMLWDRGEADGYAQHMTDDPYPNTPKHQVLMHVALGDYQVTNFSAEVEALTIGARVMDTALMPGRRWTVDQGYFGLQPMPRDGNGVITPYVGSALVYWDSGNYLPPNGNIPPRPDGGDPHEDPRRDPRGGMQKAHFFRTGEIIDVMNGGPYLLCRPGAESQIPRVPSQFNFDWCV